MFAEEKQEMNESIDAGKAIRLANLAKANEAKMRRTKNVKEVPEHELMANELVNATRTFTNAQERVISARKNMKKFMDDNELKIVQHNGWVIHTINWPKIVCEPIKKISDIKIQETVDEDYEESNDDINESKNDTGPSSEELDRLEKMSPIHDSIDIIMKRSKKPLGAADVVRRLNEIEHPKTKEVLALYQLVFTYLRSNGKKYKQLEDKRYIHMQNHIT